MSQNESSLDGLPLQQRYISFGKVTAIIASFALGNFYFGYSIAYFSSIDFSTIADIFGIEWPEKLAQGLLTGCIPIGGGIGALSSGVLLKNLTRRQFVLVVNAIAFVLGVLVFIQNPYILLIVRIFQGVCVGLYSAITPVIVKQLSPNQISGTMGAINQLYIASGVFFAFFFKFILEKISDDQSGKSIWIFVFGLPLVTIAIQTALLLFVYKYQTPKYLLENDREQQAIILLRHLYKEQFVEEVLEEKYTDIGKGKTKKTSNSIFTDQKDQRTTSVTESLLNKQKKQPTKLAIFIALHLAVLQQFVGINAVVGYGGDIVNEVLPSLKSIFPMIINLEQVLTTFIVGYLLSKLGRKTILQFGTAVGAISTGVIGLGFVLKDNKGGLDFGAALILIGLIVFMANFGISLGPVVWLYIPQIVQPNIIAFSTGANWGAASLVMLLFPIIKSALPNQNPAFLFFFFSLWCAISFVVNGKFTVETKGKTEKQIYEEYEKL